VNIDKIVI